MSVKLSNDGLAERKSGVSGGCTTRTVPRRSVNVRKPVIPRERALAAMNRIGGEHVSFDEISAVTSTVCEWCGMGNYRAVCADCCLLRFVSVVLNGRG